MRPGVPLLASCQSGDWGQLLLTTYAHTLTGGLVPCGWLNHVTREAWIVAPPISVKARTAVTCCGGWVRCIWIMYAYRRSVEVLLLTGTLVLRILVCCLTGLCFRLLRTCHSVPNLLTVLQCQLDQSDGDPQRNYSWFCTATVCISCGTMASGDGLRGQHKSDRSGVTFQYELRKSWNAPKCFVDLDSPGIVVLDITVVLDVLRLNAYRDDAELVWVLPGASPNIIRILVPDDRANREDFMISCLRI